MSYCRNCGRQIPDGVKFCNYCGSSQSERTVQPAPQYEYSNRDEKQFGNGGGRNKILLILISILVIFLIASVVLVIYVSTHTGGADKEQSADWILTEDVSEAGEENKESDVPPETKPVLAFSQDSYSVEADQTVKISVDAENLTESIVYSSSDDTIASVDSETGEVTGKKEGTVIITAASGSVSAEYTLNVSVSTKVLYEYMHNLNWLTEVNSYPEMMHNNYKHTSGINEGTVTALITDIDADDQDELLYIELKNGDEYYNGTANNIYMVVVENIDNEAVEAARLLLSDEESYCLCGYQSEDLKIAYQNGKILYIGRQFLVEQYAITYAVAEYDGKDAVLVKQMYDPGYSSGSAVFDVTNCSIRDYYNSGTKLYSYEEGFGESGIYDSYSDAITEELSLFNVTGDSSNLKIPEELLICIMTASTESVNGSVVYSSVENRGLKQDSEPVD